MIKGIAFDMDGTLIDSQDSLIAGEIAAFAEKKVKITAEELKKFGGISVKDMVKAFLKSPTEQDVIDIRRIRKDAVLKNLHTITPFPETKSVLKKLRSLGIKLSIATGLGGELLPAFLQKTGLSDLIDEWVSSDSVKAGKPAPDVFLKAFELMSVKVEEGLAVGDSRHDITAAKAAKIKSVLIRREGDLDCGSDYTISNLEELLEIIKVNT